MVMVVGWVVCVHKTRELKGASWGHSPQGEHGRRSLTSSYFTPFCLLRLIIGVYCPVKNTMKIHRHSTIWLIIALLGLASLLAGCGQKGPLRLPDETPVATQQK